MSLLLAADQSGPPTRTRRRHGSIITSARHANLLGETLRIPSAIVPCRTHERRHLT
ncbi:hypothetical protein [Sphingopyxis macrogoltabida]|uniref:hypothetical protein n=1 Tax=Sphingopyxis macrogoltabida TaxID=33050 RepID=UPI0012E17C97|nr:hypothetical protein [Sphingopyxis macrogoltabida]